MNKQNTAKALRWIGRIIGIPVIVFFLVFGLGYFIDTLVKEGLQEAVNGVDGLIMAATILLATAGIILSWWKLLPAGIILILAYLLGGIGGGWGAAQHVGFYNWQQFRDLWTLPGMVYLVSGILFLISHHLTITGKTRE
jgi:hypothetical protein